MAGCGCAGRQHDPSSNEARLDALEAKVEMLEVGEAQEQAAAVRAAATFDIDCPAPWQPLGPAAESVWTCRANRPSEGGLWPNCNVTMGPATQNTNPQQYFEQSLASVPQLKAARRLNDRSVSLGGVPAHEAVYEHDLLGRPLRVLATVGVIGTRVYAVSCSAAPEAFSSNLVAFGQITQSFRPRP